MSRYLAASINLSDGRVIRIGPDESQVGDIPLSFTFQTQIPGGFGPASLVIPRPPNLYADDARLFSSVVVYGEGMRIVYEGYVTGLPQQGPDEIQLQLTGWSAVLDRIANFRQIFVDRDLSKWREPSGDRRLEILNTENSIQGPQVSAGQGGEPILSIPIPDPDGWGEAWFDAGPGLTVSRVYWKQFGGVPSFDSTRNYRVSFENQDSTVSTTQSVGLASSSNRLNKTTTVDPPTRYICFRAASYGAADEAWFKEFTIYGNHGLVLAGQSPSGVFGSDAIAYMVGATPLSILPDSVEQSDFILPHLSFTTDISIREAIEQINVLGGKNRLPNDWGVYDNQEFFWRSPGTYGKTWIVNKDNLSNVRSDGPDSALRVSGVKVNYQNAGNAALSVGPPNSFSDYETERLLTIDPDNPALTIPGYHTESVGITTLEGAINIGRVLLNERNRLRWRGDVELQGEVLDSEGKSYPVHRVRAGDQLIVQDDDDKRPRPINSTTYSHDNLSLNASLGAVPDTLDSLLARLAAVTDLFV